MSGPTRSEAGRLIAGFLDYAEQIHQPRYGNTAFCMLDSGPEGGPESWQPLEVHEAGEIIERFLDQEGIA